MVYEYKLTCNPPYSILLSGENVQHMLTQEGARLLEDPLSDDVMVEFPFTQTNALMLREFLKGRAVQIAAKDKSVLRRLADDPKAVENKDLMWSRALPDLRELPGIKRSRTINNGFDLLHYLPLRYIDKSNPSTVASLTLGDWAVIAGKVVNNPEAITTRAGEMVKIVVEDHEGGRITGSFFQQRWLAWTYKTGDQVVMYGNYSEYVNQRDGKTYPQLSNPKVDKLTSARGGMNMIPIYPQKKQDKSWEIQNAQTNMLNNLVFLEDPVPQLLIDRYSLMSRDQAYRQIHFPDSMEMVEKARDRIAFDEFIRLQVYLHRRRELVESRKATVKADWTLADRFEKSLPFKFTEGQKEAIQDLKQDMGSNRPMYRLLQADVGAGKAQPLYSKVLTPSGFKTMGEIQPGDEVITPAGTVETVVQTFPQGERPVYELVFDDGTKVQADENHLWKVSHRQSGDYGLMTTLSLRDSLLSPVDDSPEWAVEHATGLATANYGIPWSRQDSPYELGVQLASSHSTDVSILSSVLDTDLASRQALAQGLLGQETLQGKVVFSTESADLADNVATLLRSLGGAVTLNSDNFIWTISGTLPGGEELTPKSIISIRYLGEEETKCILISGEDHLYVTDDFTVTHNTEIATYGALMAVANGEQVAVLAPTDILATQLAERFDKTFKAAGLDVNVQVINGRIIGKRREKLLAEVADGTVDVLVGTHIVTYPEVQFKNLGLAVVDEQHKFGTEQRTNLLEKAPRGLFPDFLMMSATPIPRTVSQVVFGDMDITSVAGLPEGRQVIETEWVDQPSDAWERIREQVAEGRQAYVVVALVDEENKTIESLQAATEVQRNLEFNVFPDLKVGMLHGKMKKVEKQDIIDGFYRGEVDVLVATSVVEVGVNVPNATVMVILNCDRFGIASLHQIRGRVGRGSHKSWCYLVGETQNPDSVDRLNALVESNDGFWLAERDLEIRGEGSLFGQLQSGASDLFVGNLREHRHLLEIAKRAAKQASKSPALVREVSTQYVDVDIQA